MTQKVGHDLDLCHLLPLATPTSWALLTNCLPASGPLHLLLPKSDAFLHSSQDWVHLIIQVPA